MNRTFGNFIRCICIGIFMAGAVGVVPVHASTPAWEQVSNAPQKYMQDSQARNDVYVQDGYVYVSVASPVTVKVYTILGQLVSQKNVPAGVSRLKLKARGIYILKMGELTRRVTI